MKKFKKIIFTILILVIVLFPVLSYAVQPPAPTTTVLTIDQACPTTNGVVDIGSIICRIGFYLNKIVPLLLLLGVLYLVWGVVQYVIRDDEEAKKRGKNKIIYGIIGLVIIVSIWGLVSVVIKTFGLQQDIAFENPASIVNNNLQTGPNACYNNYTANGSPRLGDVINYVTCIISSSVIPLIFTLAVASFIWGVVQYVINDQEEAKRAKGREFMLWGIIALAVMVSVWGIVSIFTTTFQIDFSVPSTHVQ